MRTKAEYLDRIDELSKLEEGWYWGEGSSISPEVVSSAKKTLDHVSEYLELEKYSVFPTISGGIIFEYMGFPIERSPDIEIMPDGTVSVIIY